MKETDTTDTTEQSGTTDRELEKAFEANEFLRALGAKARAVLARHATKVEHGVEDYLFRQDRDAERFWVIVDGEVSVEVPAAYGPPLSIQKLRGGDVVGWSWLFPPHRWHFDARVVRRTVALEFDGVALRAACEKDHEVGYEVLRAFALLMQERLEAARQRVIAECGEV